MRNLHISAGGSSSRIREHLDGINAASKHTLEIPTAEKTLIGHILAQASAHFDQMQVWTNAENIASFLPFVVRYPKSRYSIDRDMTGPLGPAIRDLLHNPRRCFSCAGDFYCDFSWAAMEDFHNSHPYPVTILIAASTPFSAAATFARDSDGRISSWIRKNRSTEKDLVNIGCYIFDPVPAVANALRHLTLHKEDPIFELLINSGLVAGYTPEGLGFNVNTLETYNNLVSHLSTK